MVRVLYRVPILVEWAMIIWVVRVGAVAILSVW